MHRSGPALAERWPALPRVLPFGLLIAGIAVDAALPGSALQLPWDVRWHYGARSVAALLALLTMVGSLPELRSAGPHDGAARTQSWVTELPLALAIGALVFLMWVAPPLRIFALSGGGFDLARLGGGVAGITDGSGFVPVDAAGRLLWGLVTMRWLGATLVVPLAEELFWRSFVMRTIDAADFRTLRPARASGRALLLQGLAFGLEHDLWLAGMLAGWAYGWLYRRTDSLWSAIAAHAVTNGLLGAWVVYTRNWAYW
jgi:CAAX prenyl protease-like protein